MKKNDIRTLASLTMENGTVNEKVRDFVLSKLSKADLKMYLFYLKSALREQQVTVRTPSGVHEASTQRSIAALFEGKKVSFEAAPELGAGLQIEYSDNVINYNLKNLIERTISSIKERL